jgi:hypothetical protein
MLVAFEGGYLLQALLRTIEARRAARLLISRLRHLCAMDAELNFSNAALPRERTLCERLARAAKGRYCCKSPKLLGAKFFVKK